MVSLLERATVRAVLAHSEAAFTQLSQGQAMSIVLVGKARTWGSLGNPKWLVFSGNPDKSWWGNILHNRDPYRHDPSIGIGLKAQRQV